MRLLYVLHQFLPRHVTGTEQYVRTLALGLKARGHEVSVLAFEPQLNLDSPGRTWIERDDEVDGIPVRRVGIHLEILPNLELADFQNPLALGFLRRYLDERDRDFDLVHVFHLRFIGAGLISEVQLRGLPVVVNLMDFWFLCPNFTLLKGDGSLCKGPPEGGLGCIPCLDQRLAESMADTGLLPALHAHAQVAAAPANLRGTALGRSRALIGRKERLFEALSQAEAIIAPSLFLRSVFADQGFDGGRILHIPYGVDPARLGGRQKQWGEDESVGLPLVIGYVGSVTRHKGLHLLISALKQIKGRGWKLDVHGSPNTHPDYFRELEALAAGDQRITFKGAFKPQELGSVLETLDLIVVPSIWYENTPFSILEAQMMRLPVLASDLGGISETVQEGRNGFLFEAGNEEALVSALGRILAEPEQLGRMQLDAACRSLDQNLDDFEALYGELLRG